MDIEITSGGLKESKDTSDFTPQNIHSDSFLGNILKNLAIGGTGLATGALGTPASLVSLMASGGKMLGQFIDPEDEKVQGLLDYLKKGAEYATPEALQSYAGKLTGGYLKPETPIQKGVSEYTQDIGSMLGVGAPAKIAIKLSTIGNIVKKGVEAAGGSKSKAETAKLIGMVTSPLFKFNKIESLYKNLYQSAEKALKKPGIKATVQSKSIRDAAYDVFNKTIKGTGKSTAKIATRRLVKGAILKLKEHQAPVNEIWEMSKDINHELAKMGKYTQQKAYFLKPFRNAVNKSLKLYGKRNKDFGYAFDNAQTLFGIQSNLPFLDKAINKTVGLKDTGLAEYFRKSLAFGVGGIKGLLAKKYLGSLSKRGEAFFRSPSYRNASIKLAKATTKKSMPMTINALRKLADINKDSPNDIPSKLEITSGGLK